MSYRNFVACALFASAIAGCSDSSEPKAPYVLVHGAWMGAWAWQPVADELRAQGAEVTVVELPAHGADITPHTDLSFDDYVSTVLTAVDSYGEPVRLVGHSMGGMVISQVADMRPDGIESLVYVSGYLPKSGETLVDLATADMEAALGPHLVFNDDGTVDIAADMRADLACADCDADALATLTANYRAEPVAPLNVPVTLTAEAFGSVPRFYIETAQDLMLSPAMQKQMYTDTPVERVITIDSSHTALLAKPAEVAAALQSL